MTANRALMDELGFALKHDERQGWLVIEDGADDRCATITEQVLWDALLSLAATVEPAEPTRAGRWVPIEEGLPAKYRDVIVRCRKDGETWHCVGRVNRHRQWDKATYSHDIKGQYGISDVVEWFEPDWAATPVAPAEPSTCTEERPCINCFAGSHPCLGPHRATTEQAKPTSIQLTAAEIQSGYSRVRWAEGLIRQLPTSHEGRNSWLLNYGVGPKDWGTPVAPAGPAKFTTIEEGTAEVVRFFTEHLRRHDFTRYIKKSLAVDFCCAIAPTLHAVMAAPVADDGCISVQEAWEAAGGNPGMKASKSDLLDALGMLDKVCDEADTAPVAPAVDKPATSEPDVQRDAARYRWLRDVNNSGRFTLSMNRRALEGGGDELDSTVDTAMLAAPVAPAEPMTDAQLDALDTFALATMAPRGRESVRQFARAVLAAAVPVAPADGWEHLKVYGYAPGDYMTRCHVCGAIANGVDKRAVTCRPCAEATHAKSKATPVVPAEPTHLRRADGTLSGMFIEPVASEAVAVAADLRNWLDFLPGHAQPTIERAVRLLETRP